MLVRRLSDYGELDFDENPRDVDLYFVHFGDGYEGTKRYLTYGLDKGIAIAKEIPNVEIIGSLPVRTRYNKVEHAAIAEDWARKFPCRRYAPKSTSVVGDELIGDKFIYRPPEENQTGGLDIELTQDAVLRRPGLLTQFIHPPLTCTQRYGTREVTARIEVRVLRFDQMAASANLGPR